MMPVLEPEFVEFIPEKLEDGKLYISEEYRTAVHKCPCGCGNKVVTPLSPTDWRLTKEGKTVSLYPSIGNWGFPCRSHYWIERNQVVESYDMSQREIDTGRRYDARMKEAQFTQKKVPVKEPIPADQNEPVPATPQPSSWAKLMKWLFG
jgi:uncharacterized protein DUF6527